MSFHESFSLNKSDISKNLTKYIYKMQVFPLNNGKHTSRNSCKLWSTDILRNFSVFTFVCGQDLKVFSFLLRQSVMLDLLYLKWTARESVSLPLLWYIHLYIHTVCSFATQVLRCNGNAATYLMLCFLPTLLHHQIVWQKCLVTV